MHQTRDTKIGADESPHDLNNLFTRTISGSERRKPQPIRRAQGVKRVTKNGGTLHLLGAAMKCRWKAAK